jgi:hypothetical protein
MNAKVTLLRLLVISYSAANYCQYHCKQSKLLALPLVVDHLQHSLRYCLLLSGTQCQKHALSPGGQGFHTRLDTKARVAFRDVFVDLQFLNEQRQVRAAGSAAREILFAAALASLAELVRQAEHTVADMTAVCPIGVYEDAA